MRFFRISGALLLSLQLLHEAFARGLGLERWQRHREFLAQRLRRIRLPPVKTITVDDRSFTLPLPATEPLQTPSWQKLEYLVGFFDGDGCVSLDTTAGRMQLSICQNVDSADVLLGFRAFLGGGVYRDSAATGTRKATVQWRIYGSKMTAAAEILSRVPSMKREQLLIAAQGNVPQHARARLDAELKRLRETTFLSSCLDALGLALLGSSMLKVQSRFWLMPHPAVCGCTKTTHAH